MALACATLLFATAWLAPSLAHAAPSGRLLRVDPRAGMTEGAPLLATLIEVGEPKSVSDVLGACTDTRNRDALYDCWGDSVEKENSLWRPFQFPENNANLFIRVEGTESPAKFVSKALFKDAQKEVGIGTAWLIALDKANSMGARYADGREVVVSFLSQMGPNDLVRLILFDDRDSTYSADSKWKSFKERNDIITKVLNQNPGVAPSMGSSRALFNTVKNIVTSGFSDLGNTDNSLTIPIHQAFVLLSNGAGRQDALSNAAGAEELKKYATNGRFPEDNTSSPKTPLPIISILFPNATTGLANSLYSNNDVQFMQALANTEVGGFFSAVRSGQGKARGDRIVKAVKSRFNSMTLVKWKLSCLNPTVQQTFNLTFTNTKQTILPDASFKEIPIGVDPSQWPLDINLQQTKAEAENNPVTPGGTVTVYGDFCWNGDKSRAEAFFVPAGTKPNPNQPKTADAARRAMQAMVAQNMRGEATELNSTFAKFKVPDDDKVLDGDGDNAVARLVVFDNRANRGSGADEKTILTLKAKKKPFPIALIAGIGGIVLVVIVLLILLLRGGGNKKRGGGGGSPQPMVAGGYAGGQGGYGGPVGPGGQGGQGGYGGGQGGYGGPSGGAPGGGQGGYGGGGQYRMDAPESMHSAHVSSGAVGAYGVAPIVAPPASFVAESVACPTCGMQNSPGPGAAAVCFSCGGSLSAAAGLPYGDPASPRGDAMKGGGALGAPSFRG